MMKITPVLLNRSDDWGREKGQQKCWPFLLKLKIYCVILGYRNQMQEEHQVKIKIKPNMRFIRTAPVKARKKWADSLRKAAKSGIKQAKGSMFYANQHGKFMCCLMVGHDDFGGDNRSRTENYPLIGNSCPSPFASELMPDYHDKEFNPAIARVYHYNDNYGENVGASEINDEYRLSFEQIASLIYSPTGHYPTIEIEG